ncbi:MAG: hypothetical protein QXP98_03400 [Thermoproteus sp.]
MYIFPKIDESTQLILSYVAIKGPVTMYRVARDLSLHFSHTYRRAKRLERLGLIYRISTNNISLYEATLAGYIYCYTHGVEPKDVILSKVGRLLGLGGFAVEDIEGFLKFYLALSGGAPPPAGLATMVAYILERCGGDYVDCLKGFDRATAVSASRIMAYGVIEITRRLFKVGHVVADRDYLAIVDVKRGRIVAAHCRICGFDRYCGLDPCPTLVQRVEHKLKIKLEAAGDEGESALSRVGM